MKEKRFDSMVRKFMTALSGRVLDHLWLDRIEGAEHIITAGPCIVIANHASYLDFLVLGSAFEYFHGRRLHFFAKQKVFEHAFFKIYCKYFECLQVGDGKVPIGVWKQALRWLRKGHMISIFPEGTRSRTGQVLPFEPGYLRLAQRARVPILPVRLLRTHQIWPSHQRVPKLLKCRVQVHAPFHLPAKLVPDALIRINSQIRETYYNAKTETAHDTFLCPV